MFIKTAAQENVISLNNRLRYDVKEENSSEHQILEKEQRQC